MLKLSALDLEDLAVISAQMQDAVLLAGDMRYDPKRKLFVLIANRFAWDEADTPQRRRTGLHFGRVLSVKTLNMRHLEYAARQECKNAGKVFRASDRGGVY